MDIKTKYSIGDLVYYTSNKPIRELVTCKYNCVGGVVQLQTGDFIQCPCCNGRINYKTIGYEYSVGGSGKIGQIDVKVDEANLVKITYMLDATGIGSGILHPQDNVHHDRDILEEILIIRNATLSDYDGYVGRFVQQGGSDGI